MEEEITAGNTGSSEGTYVKANAPEFNFDTEIKEQAAAEAANQEKESAEPAAAATSTPSPKAQPAGEQKGGNGFFRFVLVDVSPENNTLGL